MKEIIDQLACHNLLQDIVEGVPIRIFWKDRDGRYLGCNSLFAKDAGLPSPDALIGKTDFDLHWGKQAENYDTDDNNIMDSNISRRDYEESQSTPEGATRWLRKSKVPLRNNKQEVIGVLGVYEDISRRRQAEISAQRLRLALDNSADHIFIIDRNSMVFIDVNETACHDLGYSREELLKIGPADLMPYESRFSLEKTFDSVIHQESEFGMLETIHARNDGSEFPVETRMKAFNEGDAKLLVAISRDISKRKKSEQNLKLTKFVMDHAPLDVTFIDAEARIRYINKTGSETLGYSQEELLKMSVQDINPDFPIGQWHEHWQALKTEKTVPVETFHRRKNGELFETEIIANYIEFGDQVYNVAFSRDITERKAFEEKLQASESRFRNIIDASPIPYAINDDQYNITYLNPAFINTFGYDLEDIPTLDAWWPKAYPDPGYRQWVTDTWQAHLERAMQDGSEFEPIETNICCKDGTTSTAIAGASPLRHAFKGNHLVTLVDITERKRNEALLEASQKKFSTLFDSSSDGLFIINMQGEFIDLNKTAHERLGYSKEEMLAIKLTELDPPEFAAKVPERLEQIRKNGMAVFETAHYHKDGSIMPVEVNARVLELAGEKVLFSVIRDISERKQLEEQLRQSQKMEAIGTLVGGIAHDFNNMLAAIQGNVYLAKRQMQEHPLAANKLANIEQLGVRATEMVQQLLTFARKDSIAMRVFSLNAFMHEGYLLARAAIPENIDHQTRVCQEELYIKGDATQLQQVMMNLLNNASDAVAGVAQPEIRCGLTLFKADKDFLQKHPQLSDNQFACITIKDNGHGIPSEQLDKIFEPFFTTKEVGKGTGLGLAMLYGAVQNHGGVVDVTSKVNKGTTFRVYLPLSSEQAEAPTEKQPACAGRHSECILLVDDELTVRQTTSEVLSSMGYRVVEAADGDQALEIFRGEEQQIDLIISDVIMPRMGGASLLQAVRDLDKQLPFILVTGYDRDHVLDKSMLDQRSLVLNKPFDFDLLSRSIQGMINTKLDA